MRPMDHVQYINRRSGMCIEALLPIVIAWTGTIENDMGTPEFNWLQLRIAEEKDRRARESMILDRLPLAVDELHQSLEACIETYNAAFGPGSAELDSQPRRMSIIVRDGLSGPRDPGRIEITSVPTMPGFQIDRGGSPLQIEVGILPGDKLFYRDREKDQYLSMEELTRRILDRTFFPKLGE